jgi:hypothetical protein
MKAVALFVLLAGVASAQITAIPAATGGGSGETNTSGDQGGGLSVRATTPKVGVRLDFRTFASADTQVLTVTNTGDLINWTAITNAANGLLKLDAGGLVPNARLQTTIASDTSGNAATATALAANGANCSAGQAPLGVDASGAVEGCFTPAGGSGGGIPMWTVALNTGTDTLSIECATGATCNLRVKNTVCKKSASTVSAQPSGGASADGVAYIYIDTGCAFRVGVPAAVTMSATGTNGTVGATTVTAYPNDVFQVGTITVTDGNFVDDFASDEHAAKIDVIEAGSNVTVTHTSTGVQISSTSSGGSPGGSATEIQYRSGASTFGAIAGTSYDSTAEDGKGRTYIGTNDIADGDEPLHLIRGSGDSGTSGRVRFAKGAGTSGASVGFYDASGTVAAGMEWMTTGVDTGAVKFWGNSPGSNNRVEIWPVGLLRLRPFNASEPSYTCNSSTESALATTRQAGGRTKLWLCVLESDNTTYDWEEVTVAVTP